MANWNSCCFSSSSASLNVDARATCSAPSLAQHVFRFQRDQHVVLDEQHGSAVQRQFALSCDGIIWVTACRRRCCRCRDVRSDEDVMLRNKELSLQTFQQEAQFCGSLQIERNRLFQNDRAEASSGRRQDGRLTHFLPADVKAFPFGGLHTHVHASCAG